MKLRPKYSFGLVPVKPEDLDASKPRLARGLSLRAKTPRRNTTDRECVCPQPITAGLPELPLEVAEHKLTEAKGAAEAAGHSDPRTAADRDVGGEAEKPPLSRAFTTQKNRELSV